MWALRFKTDFLYIATVDTDADVIPIFMTEEEANNYLQRHTFPEFLD